jgi:predicted Zn-dependent peptidase
MSTRLAFTVTALLLGAASVSTGERAVLHRVLGNGMTVVVRENAAAGVVAMALHVRGGAREETPDAAGVTNLLHRVMLRGTARQNAAQIAEAAETIGGTLEVSGEADHAEVRGAALARHWQKLLSLIATVALEPALATAEIERERRLVLGEMETRADNPFPLALDVLLRDLYGAHPYALPTAGLRASVEKLSREALVARHRQIYRPERMVLAVSGRLSAPEVVKLTERLFGGRVPDASVESGAPGDTAVGGAGLARRRVVEKGAQQVQVLVGFIGPALAEPEYPAVKVLSAVLGGGLSGRLFVELREKRALAYSVGIVNPWRAGPGHLVAHIGTEPRNAAAAEAGLRREMERVRTEEVSDAELARAKAYLLGAFTMDRRTNARQAWYLAFFESAGVGWNFPDRYAAAVSRVSAGDVRRVAERYLAAPTVVVLLPPPA